MKKEYYGTCFIIDYKSLYLIYIEDVDYSGFLSINNELIRFEVYEEFTNYLENNYLLLENDKDITIYDFDQLSELIKLMGEKLDCNLIINYWNIVDDVCNAQSLDFIGKNKRFNEVYEKLFRGCNTAANIFEYNHVWNEKELDLIKEVMISCVAIVENLLSK